MSRNLILVLLAGCAAPDPNTELTDLMDVSVVDGQAVSDAFIDTIANAEDTLSIALPTLEDLDLAQAIVDAHQGGVSVEVIADVDEQADAGFALLDEAEVPVTYGDGAVSYFDFSINSDVDWDSDEVRMTHSFVIADGVEVTAANHAGSDETGGDYILTEALSEDMAWDLASEHNQIFGGTDASALTAYSGMAKSVTDANWVYQSNLSTPLQMWMNPQERAVKMVIDSIYAARSSVWVLTDDFSETFLAVALQDKAERGFDVQLVVGEDFGTADSQLSRELEGEITDVDAYQTTGHPPTLVLIDFDPESMSGVTYQARAFWLNHDLYSAGRLDGAQAILSATYMDGVLFILENDDESLNEPMNELYELFQGYRDQAEAL